MKRIFRNNGLSIIWLTLFVLTLFLGQSLSGYQVYNDDQRDHGQPEIDYVSYLGSAHFVEATMENWESEFLQMFLFIVLTAYLYQKGSAESKKLKEEQAQEHLAEGVDRDPQLSRNNKDAPWPVRRGGIILTLYSYSLSLIFLVLFVICFFLHAASGAQDFNQEQLEHGHSEQVSTLQYLTTARFWFESTQNWQSEFLAVGAMVVFSIFLRHKGSPESKPVDAPHRQTGKE